MITIARPVGRRVLPGRRQSAQEAPASAARVDHASRPGHAPLGASVILGEEAGVLILAARWAVEPAHTWEPAQGSDCVRCGSARRDEADPCAVLALDE